MVALEELGKDGHVSAHQPLSCHPVATDDRPGDLAVCRADVVTVLFGDAEPRHAIGIDVLERAGDEIEEGIARHPAHSEWKSSTVANHSASVATR